MSRRLAASLDTDARSQRDRKIDRKAGRDVHAQRGVLLQVAREGKPRSLLALLQRLESDGHVAIEDFAEADGMTNEVISAESVPEIDLNDEEDVPIEVWSGVTEADDAGSLVLGEAALTPGTGPLIEESFSLVVTGDSCTFSKPDWAGCYTPRTPVGQQVLHEVSGRFALLDRFARWLQESRKAFLRSMDLWDLGPRDMLELESGRVSVLQKDILGMFQLQPPVSEASFSRFIRASTLVWGDGVAPLSILFSEAAGIAWVARGVWLFAGGSLTAAVLRNNAGIKVQKGKANRNKSGATPIGSMDFQAFIEYANRQAGTKWSAVLERYQDRMLMPHGDQD
jgi:hypothetical protein